MFNAALVDLPSYVHADLQWIYAWHYSPDPLLGSAGMPAQRLLQPHTLDLRSAPPSSSCTLDGPYAPDQMSLNFHIESQEADDSATYSKEAHFK